MRPVELSPSLSIMVVFSYWSEITLDGSSMDWRISDRLYLLAAAVNSGPTDPPSLENEWQRMHWESLNAAFPFSKFRPWATSPRADSRSESFHSLTNFLSRVSLKAESAGSPV